MSLDNVIRTYRRYAPVYDSLFGAVLEPGRRALAQAVSAAKPSSLLEVGVGTGLLLHRYPKDVRIVGIDVSPEMLHVAKHRVADRADRTELRVMNAEQMDFADSSFDCVTLPYVLSVTPNPAKLVSEVRRVCKDGGSILLVNHFSGSKFWWLLEKSVSPLADRIGFRSRFHFREQVLAYDWDVIDAKPVNLFGLSKLVSIRNNKA
jgi:phosphatidylethanolamine/phosphatidyl-N-methylethanolamine N-methyltransferase